MTPEDALYRYRLRALALAEELGSVRAACKMLGIHRSTCCRWKARAEHGGLDMLRPRGRRRPRMPNAASALTEQRVTAFALAHPGFGPARIAAELAHPKRGGLRISRNGVWRILARRGLGTRRRRLALAAGFAAPPAPERPGPAPERHLEASEPGKLVQFDCFRIGRLRGVKGVLWQYTAIDVASAFTWAELHLTAGNPTAGHASGLARRVAADLAARGWELGAVTTDNGSEFRARGFGETVAELGAEQRFIRPGRPQTNGCVERVQGTIPEECWKPAFARHLTAKQTGLRRDLEEYLDCYNTDRAHTGRLTRGRTPASIIGKAEVWS